MSVCSLYEFTFGAMVGRLQRRTKKKKNQKQKEKEKRRKERASGFMLHGCAGNFIRVTNTHIQKVSTATSAGAGDKFNRNEE